MNPKLKRILWFIALPFSLAVIVVAGAVWVVSSVLLGVFKALEWSAEATISITEIVLGLIVWGTILTLTVRIFGVWAWEAAMNGTLDAVTVFNILFSMFGCYLVLFVAMRFGGEPVRIVDDERRR